MMLFVRGIGSTNLENPIAELEPGTIDLGIT